MLRQYLVHGRNGYYGIDEHYNGIILKTVDYQKTKKNVDAEVMAIRCAYSDGRKDALVGLKVPLTRDIIDSVVITTPLNYPTLADRLGKPCVILAGTMVKVLSRDMAWFKIVTDDGLEAEVTYPSLRNE
jgi:hypothetical protein